jgi:hypothetical protein
MGVALKMSGRVQGSGFRVQGSGFRVQGWGLGVGGWGLWVGGCWSAGRVMTHAEGGARGVGSEIGRPIGTLRFGQKTGPDFRKYSRKGGELSRGEGIADCRLGIGDWEVRGAVGTWEAGGGGLVMEGAMVVLAVVGCAKGQSLAEKANQLSLTPFLLPFLLPGARGARVTGDCVAAGIGNRYRWCNRQVLRMDVSFGERGCCLLATGCQIAC